MSFLDENISPSVTQETDAALVSLGQRGCVCVYDEGTVSGNFAAVQCITACTFLTLDTVEGSGANSPFQLLVAEAISVPAGTVLYGPFTSVRPNTTQFAICYKA